MLLDSGSANSPCPPCSKHVFANRAISASTAFLYAPCLKHHVPQVCCVHHTTPFTVFGTARLLFDVVEYRTPCTDPGVCEQDMPAIENSAQPLPPHRMLTWWYWSSQSTSGPRRP